MAILFTCLIMLGAYWLFHTLTQGKAHLPPGPKALPVIGTTALNTISADSPLWLKLKEWHKTFGPLVTVYMGRQPVVFIGSRSMIRDMFEKRGRIYSSRPRMVMPAEIMTHGDHIVFMPYGPKWRKHHRIQGVLLNQRAVRHYRQLLDLENLITLRSILADPQHIEKEFRRYLGSLMNTLSYGEDTVDHCNAPQLKEVESIARAFAHAVGAGKLAG